MDSIIKCGRIKMEETEQEEPETEQEEPETEQTDAGYWLS